MRLVRKVWWVGWRSKMVTDVGKHIVDPVLEHLDFMPSGTTTLEKHVVEVLSVFELRCIVVNVDKQWLRWWLLFNPGGGCGNPGGGRETRGGGDRFEGHGGQLFTVDT
ncbi:hypothetical protein Tco_0984503 [Tanacetum coccineum]